MKELSIKTKSRDELVDITYSVQKTVGEEKINGGLCIIYCPHSTAAVTINENADPSVKDDILKFLRRIVPADAGYAHAEGNSDAHIKASLMGNSRIVPISNGKLVLGTWEGIFFCEFDGPRSRKLLVSVLGK